VGEFKEEKGKRLRREKTKEAFYTDPE